MKSFWSEISNLKTGAMISIVLITFLCFFLFTVLLNRFISCIFEEPLDIVTSIMNKADPLA